MLDQLFDEFEQTQELMLRELKKINSKGDLSKDELCIIKEMVETIYKMQIAEAMADGDEYDDESMIGDYMHRGSYARGRDMRTGRYVSRRGSRSYRGSYDMNPRMSGHSINDRMVATLENMMDQAGSDYDRQQISEWIHKIRMDETKQ